MNNQGLVQLNREYTLFSWAAQAAVDPIPVARAEGVHVWNADLNALRTHSYAPPT